MEREPETIDHESQRPAPIPKERKGKLATIKGCRLEMCRVYAQAKKGDLAYADMSRAIFALRQIAETIMQGELEQRLMELEGSGALVEMRRLN